MKSTVVVMVMVMAMGTLVVKTEADSLVECYKGCFVVCAMQKKWQAFVCPFTCLKDCLQPPTFSSLTPSQNMDLTQHLCQLSCASSRCISLSSLQNPNEKKVETCLNSCSETCTKS
ncbi:PREDICTED: thionin-like protein 2 [Tarenaya hassleriana]|uniref:thionin-like protein 2 n=1 Tax=Tarenaya hassleriana TaxID=28532 RepID=UPI00053C75CA|nr:PREDICTED: thionin-like protein 2 [Tarenaya hassleriana]